MSADQASSAASGSVLDPVRALQHTLYRSAKADPGRRFHALRDKVYRRDVLWRAWVAVRRNGGAPGVDGTTLAEVEEYGVDRFLDELAEDLRADRWRPLPARRVLIPKPGTSEQRPLSIPSVRDRVVAAAVKIVLEPIFEAGFLSCSFGFRPKRSTHDALQVLIDESWQGKRWVVETDIANCFSAIPHEKLMQAIEERVSDQGVLKLLRAMLRAGVMQDGSVRREASGTPQGGPLTPPTQLAIGPYFALRVGVGVVVGPAARVVPHRDGVADGDLFGADENVFDEQAQDALAFGDGRCGGLAAQPGEEVFEVVGELEVDLPVGELAVERVDLVVQAGLAGAQLEHAGPELVEGDQLLLVGADEPGDRRGGLGQSGIETLALDGGGVRGADLLEPLVDLVSDQGRVGKQGGDVVPDDGVEVVCAHRLVGADPAVLVAVVVRAEAAVVVDLLVGGACRRAIVGVAAADCRRKCLAAARDSCCCGRRSAYCPPVAAGPAARCPRRPARARVSRANRCGAGR